MGVKGHSSQLLFSNSDSRHPLWHVYWNAAANKVEAAIIGGGGYSLGGYTGHVGEIMTWAGDPNHTTVNEHWVHCDGRTLWGGEGSIYAALFKAIGKKYGGGSGDHFNLPDLRGRMLVGDASGVDPSPTRSALAYSTTASIPHSCTLADCSFADVSGVCGFNTIRAASLTRHTHGVGGGGGALTVSTPVTSLLTSLAHTHTLSTSAAGNVSSPSIRNALVFTAGHLDTNGGTANTHTPSTRSGRPGRPHSPSPSQVRVYATITPYSWSIRHRMAEQNSPRPARPAAATRPPSPQACPRALRACATTRPRALPASRRCCCTRATAPLTLVARH